MADLSDNTNWFETDASNNKASPNGWPEGMMPSGVNDTARADKGALKRFWDRINPVQQVLPVGNMWTFTTSNTAYPTAYVEGEIYTFLADADGVGGDQFQVNALGPKPIWKNTGPAWTPVLAKDIASAHSVSLIYNNSLASGSGAFILINPFVPISGDGAGGISVAGGVSLGSLTVGTVTVSGGLTAASISTNTLQANGSGTAIYAPNGNIVGVGGYFGGDVTIHGGGAAALNVDNGGINAQLVTLYGGGSTVLNVPSGGITVAGFSSFGAGLAVTGAVSAPLFAGPSGGAGNIKCFGGDWGNMAFAISGGSFLISPDNGSSGYVFSNAGAFSDARLKTDIRDTDVDALAAICATPVRAFAWNERGRELMPYASPEVPCGLVAQELEETIPFAVGISALAGDMRHIDHQNLVPYLLRAIQQLTERVVQLEHVVSV